MIEINHKGSVVLMNERHIASVELFKVEDSTKTSLGTHVINVYSEHGQSIAILQGTEQEMGQIMVVIRTAVKEGTKYYTYTGGKKGGS